mmetsp:Transcript_74667/g.199953  ORF Transcript_74667/g.199953 Transcript_74667/m.199953 type:complete len:299 (-) Transcript_74667:307-1203(-)
MLARRSWTAPTRRAGSGVPTRSQGCPTSTPCSRSRCGCGPWPPTGPAGRCVGFPASEPWRAQIQRGVRGQRARACGRGDARCSWPGILSCSGASQSALTVPVFATVPVSLASLSPCVSCLAPPDLRRRPARGRKRDPRGLRHPDPLPALVPERNRQPRRLHPRAVGGRGQPRLRAPGPALHALRAGQAQLRGAEPGDAGAAARPRHARAALHAAARRRPRQRVWRELPHVQARQRVPAPRAPALGLSSAGRWTPGFVFDRHLVSSSRSWSGVQPVPVVGLPSSYHGLAARSRGDENTS